MKKLAAAVAGLIFLFNFVDSADAQDRSPQELDRMLGPIALYPDPLIAEILSAATFPGQIVEADRYISGGGDANQIDQEPWDPSVQALCHYPNVLKWLDDNIAWTTQMGQAFAAQQVDVMASIQRLRAQAQSLGNLPSTAQETVADDDGDIEIEPADPDELYVPDYDPNAIYYQPGLYCVFGIGLPIGGWFIHDWDWHSHRLIAWGPGHSRPGGWWHESPVQRHAFLAQNHIPAWRPGGAAVGRIGGDRGYAPEIISRSVPEPVIPRSAAPRVGEAPSAAQRIGEDRAVTRPAFRAPSAELPRSFNEPAERASSFGGFQNGAAARESSFRGAQSRGSSGGGGGGFHGGGGSSGKR
jgi:uncharacterized membrane protein YgcG